MIIFFLFNYSTQEKYLIVVFISFMYVFDVISPLPSFSFYILRENRHLSLLKTIKTLPHAICSKLREAQVQRGKEGSQR